LDDQHRRERETMKERERERERSEEILLETREAAHASSFESVGTYHRESGKETLPSGTAMMSSTASKRGWEK
jgi:hypothetical protein